MKRTAKLIIVLAFAAAAFSACTHHVCPAYAVNEVQETEIQQPGS